MEGTSFPPIRKGTPMSLRLLIPLFLVFSSARAELCFVPIQRPDQFSKNLAQEICLSQILIDEDAIVMFFTKTRSGELLEVRDKVTAKQTQYVLLSVDELNSGGDVIGANVQDRPSRPCLDDVYTLETTMSFTYNSAKTGMSSIGSPALETKLFHHYDYCLYYPGLELENYGYALLK